MSSSQTMSPRRPPTMANVARAAGVSPATVSYVLSGRGGDSGAARISDETRDRVHAAMREIGYAVNESARSLRRNRTDRVLLLIDRLSSPYEQRLATELEAVLLASGRSLSIMVCPTLERLESALGLLQRRLADGAIVESRMIPGMQEVLERVAGNAPVVAINTVLEPNGFDVVSSDEAPALEAGVAHLLDRGHRRFGYIAHDLDNAYQEPRLPIVQRRLALASIEILPELVVTGARDRVSAFTAAREILDRPDRPTALISASDIGAISAIWAAQSLGLRVPDDVAIVGVGNIAEGAITVPPLSSVGPVEPDFSPVATMLIDRLDATTPLDGRRLSVPWRFVPRGSS